MTLARSSRSCGWHIRYERTAEVIRLMVERLVQRHVYFLPILNLKGHICHIRHRHHNCHILQKEKAHWL